MGTDIQEQRSVVGWSGEHGATVDNHGSGKVERGDVVPTTPHEPFGRLIEIGCVQAPRQPTNLAPFDGTARPFAVFRAEDLGQVVRVKRGHGEVSGGGSALLA